MKIPLSFIQVDKLVRRAALTALDSGKFILGKQVKEFEEQFAKLCNVKNAACVGSGTGAIFLALKCLNLKKGDEVIVPSLSFIASATPLLMHESTPKFVDIDEKNYTIDPVKIEEKITRKTKGIIAVHLYGHPANMERIKKIAKNHSLFVLEDAAQAHSAEYKKKMVGSIGDVACFSFYPSKNLTVCGDGGMVTSNDKDLISKVKLLRNHGRSEKYLHHVLGYNLRFNEIQAAIGKTMLNKLQEGNKKRRRIAKFYKKNLSDQLIKPFEEQWAIHVYHMYTIRTKHRNELQKYLEKHGVSTGIHYPIPIHKQPIFKSFNKLKLPISEQVCNTTLSIPMFPNLSEKQQEFIVETINQFFERIPK